MTLKIPRNATYSIQAPRNACLHDGMMERNGHALHAVAARSRACGPRKISAVTACSGCWLMLKRATPLAARRDRHRCRAPPSEMAIPVRGLEWEELVHDLAQADWRDVPVSMTGGLERRVVAPPGFCARNRPLTCPEGRTVFARAATRATGTDASW